VSTKLERELPPFCTGLSKNMSPTDASSFSAELENFFSRLPAGGCAALAQLQQTCDLQTSRRSSPHGTSSPLLEPRQKTRASRSVQPGAPVGPSMCSLDVCSHLRRDLRRWVTTVVAADTVEEDTGEIPVSSVRA